MIKYNNSDIIDWNFDDSNIIKVYHNGAVVFYKFDSEQGGYKVCYAVVDDITQYSETEFEDVYDKATEKWYKLNSLNQYEEYGVYASGRTSCEGSTSRLPKGYTEVEYIRQNSNYNAYINTGVIIFDNTTNTYTIATRLTSEFHSNLGCATIISCERVNSPYDGLGYRYKCSSTVDQLEFFGGHPNYSSSSVDNGDGTRTITFTSTGNSSFTTDVPLSYFASFSSTTYGTNSTYRYSDATIYSATIVKNGITVREFVPAKRNSDSVYGLYDLINDVFYTSPNGNNFIGGDPVTPTGCVTTYEGKLTIDDGYEYEWNGSNWVNLGEVTGSTATLPDVPFTLNYNAKNYDASTHVIAKTSGQLNDIDAVITGTTSNISDYSSDGYIRLTGSSSTPLRARVSNSSVNGYFNRNNTSPNLTVIAKILTQNSNTADDVLVNRDGNYNWMYRHKPSLVTLHGSSEQGSIAVSNTVPNICSARVASNRLLTYNNWTQNTTSTYNNFNYGNTTTDGGTLFASYVTTNDYFWKGDFYWIYMSLNTLTDEQVQQVIDYNEENSQTIYPKYYDEIADPLDNLTFNTMEDAQAYAEANCVYDGMHATIGTDRYYFDSSDENGWVKILEYYKFEDVTPGGSSGWTISGSSTYNPDSSYYDDFNLETTSTSNVTKIAKVTIYGYDHFTYYLRTTGRTNYCYAVATNVDEVSTPPSTMSYNSSSAITNTYYWNKSPKSAVNLSNYRRVTYNNLDKTVEHTFYVYFYGRTYSSYVGNATILIPKEQANENWEQVTFSASSNVASSSKSLYIDGNNSTSGGTNYFYYRWIVGLSSGSHSSYTNYSNYDYCPNVTSSTFTSVDGEQRQVNFTYDNTTNKTLSFRLTDGSNVLTPSNTVYFNMAYYNSCGVSSSTSNVTFPRSQSVKVGGRFRFGNSSNRHYIYGYSPNISLNTDYYVNNYQSTFNITYTKLSDEAVTVTYTTYDPSDTEVPAFKTDITWPYSGGTTSSTTLASYTVPYTYSYEVSQTSDKFSADSQTYTAGQSSRTINFVLYPNNREFATVADMEAYAYAWEGMKATVGDTKYEYKNGEWVEYAVTIWLDPSATNALFSIGHYWGENYKIVFTTYLSGSYSGDFGSFWQGNGHTPIELSFYSNGFYYDMHNPTSTTAPNVRTTDYDYRILRQNAFSSYENSQKIKITLTYGSFKAELEETGAVIYSSGSTRTGFSWYDGLYQVNIGLNNASAKCHLSHIQIYNGNNELVNDFKFIKNNGVVGSQEISIYDSVTNTTYNNTNSNTPVYHIEI